MSKPTKNTDFEWISLKHLCVEPGEYGLNVTPDQYVDQGVRLIRTSDIVGLSELTGERGGVYVEATHCAGKMLNRDDLLFSRSGTTGRCLLYAGSSSPSTFAGFLIRFRLKPGYVPRFVAYCSLTKFFEDSIATNAVQSTISNFNASRYGDLKIPVPTLLEQRAIADYLDAETGRIDALIEKKRRLVGLLTERRQAVITEAVTKGLDRDVVLKASGVDWLGDIPTHWEVKRLKYVANIRVSNVDKHIVEGQPNVRLVNYTDVYYNDSIAPYMPLMESTTDRDKLRKFRVRVGDSIITKDSETPDDIGVPAHVTEAEPDMVCGYHLAILRPKFKLTQPKFLFYVAASRPSANYWSSKASGLTRYGLKIDAIGSVHTPHPPLQEQRVIADHLDAETGRIDALVVKLDRQIELLVERRQAVITAAVTGKLHVKDMAERGIHST